MWLGLGTKREEKDPVEDSEVLDSGSDTEHAAVSQTSHRRDMHHMAACLPAPSGLCSLWVDALPVVLHLNPSSGE